MLVIDDNKLKLLRMKEKLLEVSNENKDKLLFEYKQIVLEIDKMMYERLINIIKNTTYHNLPLEEQLQVLTNLESEYNSFNEFQCRYKGVYEKYANEELKLSLIEDIYIDKIKNKIDAINGYLINNQNLSRYRNELEKMNVELIESEKKKEAICSRFELLEQELKNNVLNAEGRIDNHGNLEYASIRKEFERYNLDLTKLLSDQELLKQEITDANSLLNSKEEKLEAAKVCFNSMPNIDTKKLYNISYHEVLEARYKINLLKFASLIVKEYANYDEIRSKRVDLINLVKERNKILIDLGIKFAVDPFDRIKLNDQLEIIELLGGNLQSIAKIKEKIKDTFDMTDRLKEKNDELYLIISQDEELYNSRIVVYDTTDDNTYDNVSNIEERKVVNVKDISSKFNFKLVREKTYGVITRVYELFNKAPVTYEEQGIVPNLVIEKSDNPLENKNDIFTTELGTQEIFESSDNALENTNDIFIDESQNKEIFDSKNDAVEKENDIFNDEVKDQEIVELNSSNLVSDKDDNLFTEVEPFEKTVLFTNKCDDVFSQGIEEKNDSDEMPELFFEFEDKSQNVENGNDNETNDLSFDEQVQELLDNDSSKVKRLVA